MEERLQQLEVRLAKLEKTDRFTLEKILQILDGRNIQVGTATGTIIGTEPTQKLALWGATPIVQQSLPSQAPNRSGTYSQSEAQQVTDAINDIRTDLINFGFYPSP